MRSLGSNVISVKTIGRLSMYRRLLASLLGEGAQYVYSHQLAHKAGVTAAQVRRDMMAVGYSGSPTKGYDVRELAESIGHFLDCPDGQSVALVGIGNLGRAILSYFAGGRRPHLSIVAAFDKDPYKVNRVVLGCRCYPMEDLVPVIQDKGIRVGVITVPAGEAQPVADTLIRAGIKGILNFAPVPIRAGSQIYVEDIDMAMSLEKVAFFARKGSLEKEVGK